MVNNEDDKQWRNIDFDACHNLHDEIYYGADKVNDIYSYIS